ncbi:hypothetical protein BC940DRAFT_351374 [Gongronella butleri]|nr:hypothetical protein BC940DRAFT_351374 [Gongronella butleri]
MSFTSQSTEEQDSQQANGPEFTNQMIGRYLKHLVTKMSRIEAMVKDLQDMKDKQVLETSASTFSTKKISLRGKDKVEKFHEELQNLFNAHGQAYAMPPSDDCPYFWIRRACERSLSAKINDQPGAKKPDWTSISKHDVISPAVHDVMVKAKAKYNVRFPSDLIGSIMQRKWTDSRSKYYKKAKTANTGEISQSSRSHKRPRGDDDGGAETDVDEPQLPVPHRRHPMPIAPGIAGPATNKKGKNRRN